MLPFLSNHGILGMNARNLLYIKPFNRRKAVAFADDKLKTKAFLSARGIPVSKVYGRISDHVELRSFDFRSLPDTCVLKPNFGFGGGGIMVLKGRDKHGRFLEQGKTPLSERQLREHIEDILDGKFSVNGLPDTAFFERILVSDPSFAPLRPVGLPDIRIVVFNLVPVMAMLRIPTAESGGKANVHMGGIGIGINVAKGVTTFATQYNRRLTILPHGGSPSGHAIPHWDEMLLIASRIQSITNIGYLAVDLTLDAEQGPVLLEVNARAGLMVQVANLAPLRSRLERVAGLKVQTPEQGVLLARELFGAKSPARAASSPVTDKPVLGLTETMSIAGAGTSVDALARISPEHERTVFSPTLMRKLEQADALTAEQSDESAFRVKFTLGGKKVQTVIREGEVPHPAQALIGRRDIGGFLIDPSKVTDMPAVIRPSARQDARAVDKFLSQADEELMLLKHVKPVNLAEEREAAAADPLYNPVFRYIPESPQTAEIESRLLSLELDDSPLSLLFRKKRRELLQRISLIRSRGDARRLTDAASALFGLPTSELIASATAVLDARTACELPSPVSQMLGSAEVAALFEEKLRQYGLHNWQINVRAETVARVTVGGATITIREDAEFAKRIIDALIAHELETHVITAENGLHQSYALFRRGFAHYLDTQEGLAIYNQNRFLSPHNDKRFGPARNVLGMAFALEHSFAETRSYLQHHLGYEPAKALTKAIDFKRGMADTSEAGAFTKSVVYFRGLRAVEEFMQAGGDMTRLYVGKIALEDLETIEQIPGLKAPLIVPRFLRETGVLPKSRRSKS